MNQIVEFLQSPPAWLLMIVVTLLAGKMLNHILSFAGKPTKQKMQLVVILELLLTVVLALLTLHSFLERGLGKAGEDHLMPILAVFVISTFCSLGLYLAAVSWLDPGEE